MFIFHALIASIFTLATHFEPCQAQDSHQASCAPTPPDSLNNATSAAGYFVCLTNTTTYVDQGSPTSPLIEDCKQIVKSLEAGVIEQCWFDRCYTDELPISIGTCHISIEAVAPERDCMPFYAMIGTGDIIEYINGAIQRFSRPDGRVAASGLNLCQDMEGYWSTHSQWTIHS